VDLVSVSLALLAFGLIYALVSGLDRV